MSEMTPENLAEVLFGAEGTPDREDLLDQGFTRSPIVTKRALPDDRLWPSELDDLPLSATGRFRIDRRLIFKIAERAVQTPEDKWSAAQLHAAEVIWGARPGKRMRWAFKPLANEDTPRRLTEALKIVRSSGPSTAYNALLRTPRGHLYTPYLGASYFTKFLYFGGWNAKPLLGQPLIMDDIVIDALTDLTKRQWHDESIEEYVGFLDLAHDVAYEAETSEDVVEWQLWRWADSQLKEE
jgi:hypothetical protein